MDGCPLCHPINSVIASNKLNETRMWAMPNVMVALPNIGGKVWLTPTTRMPCSNAAKMRKPSKLAGMPQTRQPISAICQLKLTILRGHVEEILLFNRFSPLSIHALVAKIQVAR